MKSESGGQVKYIDGINKPMASTAKTVQVSLELDDITLIAVHRQSKKPAVPALMASTAAKPQTFFAQAGSLTPLQPTLRLRRTKTLPTIQKRNQTILSQAQTQARDLPYKTRRLLTRPPKTVNEESLPELLKQKSPAVVTKTGTRQTNRVLTLPKQLIMGLIRRMRRLNSNSRLNKLLLMIISLQIIVLVGVSYSYYQYQRTMNSTLAAQRQEYESNWAALQSEWSCIVKQWQDSQAVATGSAAATINGGITCQQ